MDIVTALRAALAGMVGRERYELWFGAGVGLSLTHDRLSITVANRFCHDFLRTNFRTQLDAAVRQVLGKSVELHFAVDADQAPPAPAVEAPALEATAASDAERRAEKTSEPQPGAAQRPAFGSLESFVTGECNRLAFASAEMTIRQPGQFSPLYLHGPTGVGKTHLLQAVWTGLRRSRRQSRVLYLSAEQFTSGFLEALRGSGLPSLRRKYRGVETLLLDDLQFLAGKRATQVELLHTVDELLREGRQLVFAADRPPTALTELAPELVARLESGMVCAVDPPDFVTRLGILKRMAVRAEVSLPDAVLDFVASRLCNHARELSGAVCRLKASSQALGRAIDLPLAEQALSEMIRHSSRAVRLPDIEKAVCDVLGVDAASLQSDCKSKSASNPRMLAMWLARKHTRAALCEIGDFFGRRTHSTVISAQKRIDQWLADGRPLEVARHTWKLDDAIRQVEKRLLAC